MVRDAIVMAVRGGRAMKMAGRCCGGGGGGEEKADRRNKKQRSTALSAFPAAYPRFISVDVAQYARLVG